MRRDQLEHLIRAAGDLLGEDTVIIIGSQPILASVPEPDDADLIDGVLGAGSTFDQTHGVHADGVGQRTATLPAGWEARLIEVSNTNTNGVRGLCLEPHDLVISKLAANREKDVEFAPAAMRSGIVEAHVLAARLEATERPDVDRVRISGRLTRWRS